MQKVVHVKAYFAPIGEERSVKVSTGEKKKGLFGGERDVKTKETQWVQTGISDCIVDSNRLAEDLNNVISSLNADNYEVVSITPISSGSYQNGLIVAKRGAEHGFGYGFSYTDSLIVVAKKLPGQEGKS